mmetsp:Transcript_20074/g.55254  ORF Transcript_20074/g.55254 Transcript_20074/m.55254 type:complete len:248 (-) Transcript_20074:909-1652(-)
MRLLIMASWCSAWSRISLIACAAWRLASSLAGGMPLVRRSSLDMPCFVIGEAGMGSDTGSRADCNCSASRSFSARCLRSELTRSAAACAARTASWRLRSSASKSPALSPPCSGREPSQPRAACVCAHSSRSSRIVPSAEGETSRTCAGRSVKPGAPAGSGAGPPWAGSCVGACNAATSACRRSTSVRSCCAWPCERSASEAGTCSAATSTCRRSTSARSCSASLRERSASKDPLSAKARASSRSLVD